MTGIGTLATLALPVAQLRVILPMAVAMDTEQSVLIQSLYSQALINHHTRFRKAGYDAIDRICAYYYSLREKPVVAQVKPRYLRDLIPGMSI